MKRTRTRRVIPDPPEGAVAAPRGAVPGQGTSYNSATYPDIAFVACSEMGALNKNLASLFKVSENCIQDWLRRHKDFRESVTRGKDIWNTDEAEKALVKRATGYEYTETIEEYSEKNGHKLTKKTKFLPPDTLALIFLLKNRDHERWRDVKRLEGGEGLAPKHLHLHAGAEQFIDNIRELSPTKLKVLRGLLEEAHPGEVIDVEALTSGITENKVEIRAEDISEGIRSGGSDSGGEKSGGVH